MCSTQDGDLSMVKAKKMLRIFTNYANKFYLHGGRSGHRVADWATGNWESTQFNSRLQPCRSRSGLFRTTDQNLLKLNFDYGTTNNNGNVLIANDHRADDRNDRPPDLPRLQTYTYDSLNRLKSATETIDGNQTVWKQTFHYDRYGNRNFDTTDMRTRRRLPTGLCGGGVQSAG